MKKSNNNIIYIDDDLIFKSLLNDTGFKMLLLYISDLCNIRVHKNPTKTYILIEDEDEWTTILEIHTLGFILIECSKQIYNLILEYIKLIPSMVRDDKINRIL